MHVLIIRFVYVYLDGQKNTHLKYTVPTLFPFPNWKLNFLVAVFAIFVDGKFVSVKLGGTCVD